MVTDVTTRTVDVGITVVELSGILHTGATLTSLENALKKLMSDGARKLVLDISALRNIDSAGIGLIVLCAGEMGKLGGVMRVAGARGTVARSFDMIHMARIVPLDPDAAAGCESIGRAAAS